LGIEYKGDGGQYEVVTLKGNCMNCTESLKYYYLGEISPHYSIDELKSDGAVMLINSEDGKGRFFAYENEGYKVITSSITAGAIANDDSLNFKPYLFSEFFNFFLGYNPTTTLQENISGMLDGKIYPNPSQSQTSITFSLGKADMVKVEIFSMNGQLIETLANGFYPAGRHQLKWGNGREKGSYVCRIISGKQVITKKLILVD